MPLHKNLTGSDLHEPKGIDGAAANTVYVADGSGSGAWTDDPTLGDITAASVTSTTSTLGTATATSMSAGSLTLSTPVWDDFRVVLSGITGGGAPAAPGWFNLASGLYVKAWDATIEESLEFTVQLPHGYKRGTNILPHVHWVASTTGAGNVVWAIEYLKMPANAAGAGTSTTIKSDPVATPLALRHSLITRINGTTGIDGSDLIESSIIVCRFYRDSTNPNDTYNGADACALFVDFHYQVEKLGSTVEIPT